MVASNEVVRAGVLLLHRPARSSATASRRTSSRCRAGAGALQVNLSGIATGSQTRFIAINPYGVPVESTASTGCYTNFSDAAVCKPAGAGLPEPDPGRLGDRGRVAPYLAAAGQPVPAPGAGAGRHGRAGRGRAAVGDRRRADRGELGPDQHLRPGPGRPAVGGPLASVRAQRPTITDGRRSQEYTVDGPGGRPRVHRPIGNTSDLGADLDLYVYLRDDAGSASRPTATRRRRSR